MRISDWSSDVCSSDRGEEKWVPLMEKFWGPFKELVDDKTESVDRSEATGARELGIDPKSGKPVSVRLGRYGPYVAIGAQDDEQRTFASLRPEIGRASCRGRGCQYV